MTSSFSIIADDVLGDEEFAASAVTSSLDDAAQEMADFITQYRERCLARRREPDSSPLPLLFRKTLHRLLRQRTAWEHIIGLRDDEAEIVLDLLQEWLDWAPYDDADCRRALYLLVKLSVGSKKLPHLLYVRDVDVGPTPMPFRAGGFADVYKGAHHGKEVVLKRIRLLLPAVSESDLDRRFRREALVWRQLKHPFILPLIGIDAHTFHPSDYLPCLVSPLMSHGTLREYRHSSEYDPSRDLYRLLREAAEGLHYLHTRMVVHGDIKEANILINDQFHVQLCDFGLVVMGDTEAERLTTSLNALGTKAWMSPQRLKSQRQYRITEADDVYAYACLCYYILTGNTPFHDLSETSAMLEVVAAQRPPRPLLDAIVTDALWDLVESCWAQDPAHRPTTTSICSNVALMTEATTTSGGLLLEATLVDSNSAMAVDPPLLVGAVRTHSIDGQHTIDDQHTIVKMSATPTLTTNPVEVHAAVPATLHDTMELPSLSSSSTAVPLLVHTLLGDSKLADPAYVPPTFQLVPVAQHSALVEILRSYRQLVNVGERRAWVLADLLTKLMRLVKVGSLELEDYEEVGSIMDLMQEWLDLSNPPDPSPSRRQVIHLMIKLSSTAGMLPRSLYVHGVDIRKDNPVAFGAMAEVFVGIQPVNGQRVALKRVRLHDELAIKRLLREALVWRQLRHPSILPFIGVDRETFAASHQLCLVSPWMRRGTVRQYIQSEDYAIHRVQDLHGILMETAEGLEYLHSLRVVHGDLNDCNILIDEDRHVRLSDFGLTILDDMTGVNTPTTAGGPAGPGGMWISADRLTRGDHRRLTNDDVYAFGCLCYYMITGHAPFHQLSRIAGMLRIMRGELPARPEVAECSDSMWALIEACWSMHPDSRPSIDEALRRLRNVAGISTHHAAAPSRKKSQQNDDDSIEEYHIKASFIQGRTSEQLSHDARAASRVTIAAENLHINMSVEPQHRDGRPRSQASRRSPSTEEGKAKDGGGPRGLLRALMGKIRRVGRRRK